MWQVVTCCLQIKACIASLFSQSKPLLGFPGDSVVKNLPAKQEMQVQPLDQEDTLGKQMVVFLPGKYHGPRSLVGDSPWGLKELGMT